MNELPQRSGGERAGERDHGDEDKCWRIHSIKPDSQTRTRMIELPQGRGGGRPGERDHGDEDKCWRIHSINPDPPPMGCRVGASAAESNSQASDALALRSLSLSRATLFIRRND